MQTPDRKKFRKNLRAWYAAHARDLPWRHTTDAYPVWLAEMMLQQTGVTTVVPYYHKFLEVFPTIAHLAAADEQAVLHLWQGLGYYSRARNLHKCARQLVQQHGGVFPTTVTELEALPGIGPYTAQAILAFAYNQPAAVVDGNVERVMSRLFAVADPLPDCKPTLKKHAQQLADAAHSRLYNNAIMELGATICTPRRPKCLLCPVAAFCAAQGKDPATYPRRKPKKARPIKYGVAYIVRNAAGQVYLRQRPPTGLLASLWEVPWEAYAQPPQPSPPAVKHVFTHFELRLWLADDENTQYSKDADAEKPDMLADCQPFDLNQLPPLPTLMQKVLQKMHG